MRGLTGFSVRRAVRVRPYVQMPHTMAPSRTMLGCHPDGKGRPCFVAEFPLHRHVGAERELSVRMETDHHF